MIVKVEDCSWEQEPAQPVNSRESEACRQRFRQFCYRDAGGPHEAFSQLWELCCRWLRPELNSKEQILELLVLEQFLAVLPGEIQARVRTQHLGSGEEAVALVEDIQNQSLKTWPQDEVSEVEPKAAVQELQATASPEKAGVQKQLRASQEQHSHAQPPVLKERRTGEMLDVCFASEVDNGAPWTLLRETSSGISREKTPGMLPSVSRSIGSPLSVVILPFSPPFHDQPFLSLPSSSR